MPLELPTRKGQIMDGMVEIFGEQVKGNTMAEKASEELQNESKVIAQPISETLACTKAPASVSQ